MSKNTTKKTSKKKINNSKIKIIAIIIIAIIIIITIVNKLQNNKSTIDKTSLIIDNQDVTSELENDILIQDNIIYISFEDIKKCLDKTIYLEEGTNLIITSSDKKIVALEIGNSDIEINGSNVTIDGQAVKTQDNIIYIPISELENVYDIEFSYIEDTKKILIDYYSKKLEKAYVTKNVSVKSEQRNSSQTISKVKRGNWVIYISEENGWARIRTQDGFLGYIKNKYLTNFVVEREDMESTTDNTKEDYLEKDITEKNIETYENRKELINNILKETVSKEYKTVKIVYQKDAQNLAFERFKIEIIPILKECGINVIFE